VVPVKTTPAPGSLSIPAESPQQAGMPRQKRPGYKKRAKTAKEIWKTVEK